MSLLGWTRADARQLYRCSGWLLEGVEHSWRARERKEHHSRAENVMPSPRSVAEVFSTLWLDLEELRQRHHSSATLLRSVVWLQNWNVEAPTRESIQALAFRRLRGTHEPQRQKPRHMSSSGSTWRSCVSCTHASLCFAARWMTSSGVPAEALLQEVVMGVPWDSAGMLDQTTSKMTFASETSGAGPGKGR